MQRLKIFALALYTLFLGLSSTASAEAPLQILSLGDSYTIGTSVKAADRWPNLLRDELIGDGLLVASPEIIARNGWTSSALLNKLDAGTKQSQYDWVTLLIGVNDQYQGRSLRAFENDLSELIKSSVSLAGGNSEHVLVLTIPDWSASPRGQWIAAEGTAKQIQRFNKILAKRVELAGVQLVDIGETVNSGINDPSYFASDGLHYSRKMHSLWAAQAAIAIRADLKQ